MTEYTATCVHAGTDYLTARRRASKVKIYGFRSDNHVTDVYLSPAAARTFARGILALADKIDGGETPSVDEPLKVGDRVEITTYRTSYYDSEYTGATGVLRQIDTDDLPYLVDTDDKVTLWAVEVRHIVASPTVVDPSSVADPRRLAALKEAQEIAAHSDTSVDVLQTARFLLGE
jgi:hypothetical protein